LTGVPQTIVVPLFESGLKNILELEDKGCQIIFGLNRRLSQMTQMKWGVSASSVAIGESGG